MSLTEYSTGEPTENGVYACRVPLAPVRLGLLEDKFLLWYKDSWKRLGSDQNYRGAVMGWIGPLQRKMP